MIDSHCHIAGPEFVRGSRRGHRACEACEAGTRARHPRRGRRCRKLRRGRGWLKPGTRSGSPSACTRTPPESSPTNPARCGDSRRRASSPGSRSRAASAKSVSTTTTTSRRARSSSRSFASRFAWRSADGLPIVIHTREAEDDTFRILDEETAADIGGVFHCFTGDRAMAQRVARHRVSHLAGRHRHVSARAGAARKSRRWCRSIGC